MAAAEDNATMSGMAAPFGSESMRAEKRTVARNSVFAALVITGLKFVVGVATGSLGIMSEAAHSALDLVAAVITLMSIRVSDKPADADHQYGHGKFENFSAFIETGLLLLTCLWIVWEAIRRLFFHESHVEPTIAAFAVMLLSIGLDLWRSRALQRIANKYDSQALQADALHFSTDVYSSGVVIVGLALVTLAWSLGDRVLLLAGAAVTAAGAAMFAVHQGNEFNPAVPFGFERTWQMTVVVALGAVLGVAGLLLYRSERTET
jgi:cation diffusion facilitator family transporter